ncbi:MAG: hypothetical protein ACR2PL_04765 [Dehalococcoidia bacterium]
MANGEDWRGLAGRVVLAEAAVLAADRQHEPAATRFEQASAIFRRYSLPWDEAQAYEVWGGFLLQVGEREPAEAKFDAAVAIYRRVGAGERWLERVQRLRTPCAQ